MQRKECDKMTGQGRLHGWGRSRGVAAILALMAPAVSTGAGRVEINSVASIRGPQIRIADIAELRGFGEGEPAAQFKELILFDAPPPGERRTFHVREIREALYDRGVNLGEIELRGSAQVTVTRVRDAENAECARAILTARKVRRGLRHCRCGCWIRFNGSSRGIRVGRTSS